MAEFQRVSALKQWVIGSLESDTGSEYLFGFDPEQGLMWLERPGHEYSSSDLIWKQAESYIRTSALMGNGPIELLPEYDEDEQSYTVPVAVSSNGDERPKTVTKSVMGTPSRDFLVPQPGDPRIVGDLSVEGEDYSEDDIAAQAAEFLMNLGEE